MREANGGVASFAFSGLSCEPEHLRVRGCCYQVAWRINPHMEIGAVDPRRARHEHQSLRDALLREGVSRAA